jgi:CheY-like chemotaxis protein
MRQRLAHDKQVIDLLKIDPQVGGVLQAPNGKAAVGIIGREPLDLVFLDVQMPERFELPLKDGHRSRVRTYRIELEKRLGQSL